MAKSDETYEYLIKQYGEDTIRNRAAYWYKMSEKVIASLKLEGKAFVSRRLLINMLANYFADIARLKEFHPIERVNIVKIFAYSVFWYLRVSPIQLKCDVPDSKGFINEKLSAIVLVGTFLPKTCTSEIREAYLEELLYFFKYRLYTAQTIESIIIALTVGAGKDPFTMNGIVGG